MNKLWWHDKIVYQIYPKSFKDENNDGVGDIKGIISKLDYLKDLGVDILWLTPFFASPMEDNGYDVSDYKAINPLFGTMDDMDELIKECKKRRMYIMMDIVANHTSDQNRWFVESRKSKDNPYRDYYIWRDKPLFNRMSYFSGSAWEYDKNTKQYYFHNFAKGQPDLNWDNPKVREEIASAINFWMEKGIRGIRFDTIHLIGKVVDENINEYGPILHQRVKELYENSYGKYDIVTVGEAWGDIDKALDFTEPKNKELNMVFQFEHVSYNWEYSKFGKFHPRPVDKKHMKEVLFKYQEALNDRSWNALFIENHDLSRSVSKFGDEKYYKESAKALATMIFLMKGTPYIYQGQELGMTNLKTTDIDVYDDVEIKQNYRDLVLTKLMSKKEFLEACNKEGRDNARTPMQWDNKVNAGWNLGHKPWLMINPNYTTINECIEQKDQDSILNYYKALISLRKNPAYKDIFTYGKFIPLDIKNDNVCGYIRKGENESILVITNMDKGVEIISLPCRIEKILLSSYKDTDKGIKSLRPYESFVAVIKD